MNEFTNGGSDRLEPAIDIAATGDEVAEASEASRRAFQDFLDISFPIGAMCAVIRGESGLDEALPVATGRLVCAAVGDAGGQHWHEIVIDPVGGGDTGDAEAICVRVGMPVRHRASTDLWEASVFDETPGCTIRMNANPPQAFRPTPAMRAAVAERYAHLLPTTVSSS